jgi:2-polyprenyl-3-methyl-5-hydroxy-6-metoxy-1,4-benzoquinol methylase|tara:strand:- start:4938 stop:5765 length:828 start_codon:yes stop_codon:yes gene_type:complete
MFRKCENGDMDVGTTVDDYSEQWTDFRVQEGYYASDAMLQDYFGPLLDLSDLDGLRVCEIGCGNGRFVKIMSRYATHVTGVEPSQAIAVVCEYTKYLSNVSLINKSLYDLEVEDVGQFDIVFCLGVLHHLPDPVRAVRKIRELTKPGGQAVIWIYGREGNKLYLTLLLVLRSLTTRMSYGVLRILAKFLVVPVKAYIMLARFVRLPLRTYVRNVLGKCDDYVLWLWICDMLNPSISNYWSAEEFRRILKDGGFADVRLHHRHGYSWTGMMTKHSL